MRSTYLFTYLLTHRLLRLSFHFIVFFQVRNQLAIQVTNLQVDLDNLTAQLEDEAAALGNAQAQLQRASADLQQLKAKYDKEVTTLSEQLDETRYY